MFQSEKLGKIKNNKIQRWRMELGCYDYDIMNRPDKNNIPADSLSTVHCGTIVRKEKLYELHVSLYHPGIIRLTRFVKIFHIL